MKTHRRSFAGLAGFAMGLFAVQTFWGFTWSTLPLFLKKLAGSNAATGILLSIAGSTGIVLPVLSGALSDRISTRWGRRKPFIAAGWAVVCCVLFCLARVTSLSAAVPLLVLAYAGFFSAMGPYFALLPNIVPVEQRSMASGVMFLVGGTGIISYLLVAAGRYESSPSFPFFWAIGGILISTIILFASVREPQDAVNSGGNGGLLRGMSGDRGVTLFYAGMILWWIGIWMVSAFFIIAYREIFTVDTRHAVRAFFVFNVSFVASAVPAGLIGARLGLKKVTAFGLFVLAGSILCTPFLHSYLASLPCIITAGAAYSVVLAVSYPYFLGIIPKENTAGSVGLYMACQNGTLLLGPAIGGLVIDRFGYTALFACASLFVFVGMCVFLAIPRTAD